jgi:predicted RND superfamily exporter protein
VIRALLWSRFASFAAVLAMLVALLLLGRHVTYEQSIQSFFPDDDPDVLAYARASEEFGNDNFVFVCYDDPALLTPAGMDRVAELAAALGPKNIPAVVHVESLDAMPVLWEIDDRLIALQKVPAFARKGLMRVLQGLVKSIDTTRGPLSIGGKVRTADEAGLAALKEKVTAHPLFRGTVIDASGTSTAVVVRLRPMAEQEPRDTLRALRERADAFARTHQLGQPALVGPPVLLADGYNAIEIDGQRLALAGMALIGLVTLSATRSIWWAIVPLLAGWVVWLATETILSVLGLKLSLSGGPLVAQIIVLTMPAASHLAIHFRDDRRQEPDRRRAAASTLKAVTAPIIWCDHRGHRLRGVAYQQRGTDPPVRRRAECVYVDRGRAHTSDLANRDAAAVSARNARPLRLEVARVNRPE